jgi:hypothetical protein
VHDLDPKFVGTVTNHLGLATGNDADPNPCTLQKLKTVTVFYIEGLALKPVIIIDDSPVGHHTVDIEKQKSDLTAARLHHATPALSRSWI